MPESKRFYEDIPVPIEHIHRFLGTEPESPEQAAERAVEEIIRATERELDAALPFIITGVQAAI